MEEQWSQDSLLTEVKSVFATVQCFLSFIIRMRQHIQQLSRHCDVYKSSPQCEVEILPWYLTKAAFYPQHNGNPETQIKRISQVLIWQICHCIKSDNT